MQRPRGRSLGWAAFDRKQLEKQGVGPERDADPFPTFANSTLSGPRTSFLPKHSASMRTFSSVVNPSHDFPRLLGNCKSEVLNKNFTAKDGNGLIVRETNVNPLKMLNDTHSWADQSLIKDILVAVDHDVEQASSILKAMVSSECGIDEASLSGTSTSVVGCPRNKKNNRSEEGITLKNKLSDGTHEVLISGQLFSVPVEPEWEEDDIYLSHRKDAIKMMRAAAQHSRASSNAFSRGDRASAHQLSMRAREERSAAEKLNARAAEEILRVRNTNNDIWTVDLHGLHATEAVAALKEHLHRIESHISIDRSASFDGVTEPESAFLHSSSSESLGGLGINTVNKEKTPVQNPRQTMLYVITGTGNHSRGQAALPTAVRSFLSENRYRFDDGRPGVIDVRPKFHCK